MVGWYVKELGRAVKYLDPMADDATDVIDRLDEPCVLLMAHNRAVTYGYTGTVSEDVFYCEIPQGSIIVDPWRRIRSSDQHQVLHYGNTHDSRR